jgi:hypothetical protein
MNDDIRAVIDELERRIEATRLNDAAIGKALSRLVRAEKLDDDAEKHRSALTQLCFVHHVFAPAIEPGGLVLSAMASMLAEAGAFTVKEMFEHLRVNVDAAEEELGDLTKHLAVEGIERGFVGARAAAAARTKEILSLDDATIERLLSEGLPRG